LNTDNSVAEVETSADSSLFYLMSLA
jgi:hypothetical protein